MKTVMEQKEKMPCFDPREVMFITNQWDIIEKYEHSSDDEDDENSIKDDQHAITWNKIQDKLKKEWDYYDVNNVFRVSLKQVSVLIRSLKRRYYMSSFEGHKTFTLEPKNSIEMIHYTMKCLIVTNTFHKEKCSLQ